MGTDMAYTVKFQSPASYSGDWYKYSTIGKSGCGPASVCNALKNAGIADVSVPTMCALAVSCGARVDGGTVMATLLDACKGKYGITYKATSKNAELMQHLKNGGTAICWCGTAYPLFASTSGHFVAAVGVDSIGRVIVADSYWFDGKITYNSVRRAQLRLYNDTAGLVTCNIDALGKATIDRSPSYYLISREVISDTKNTKKDVEDMTESDVKKIIAAEAEAQAKKAVSNWATDAWNAAVSAGVLDGTAPQGNLTREQFAVVLRRLGMVGGSDTPSSWAADAWTAATDAGVLDGTNPHGVVTREMLAQVVFALGLLEHEDVDLGTMESHKSTD